MFLFSFFSTPFFGYFILPPIYGVNINCTTSPLTATHHDNFYIFLDSIIQPCHDENLPLSVPSLEKRVFVVSRMPPELDEHKEEVFEMMKDLIKNNYPDSINSIYKLHSDLETHLDSQIRDFNERYKDENKYPVVQIHEDVLMVFAELCPELNQTACINPCIECRYIDDQLKQNICRIWHKIYDYPFRITHRNRLFIFLDGIGAMHNSDNERNIAFKVKTFIGFLDRFYEMLVKIAPSEAMNRMNDALHNAGSECGAAFGKDLFKLLKRKKKLKLTDYKAIIKQWCDFDTEAGFGIMDYKENNGEKILTINNLFILVSLKKIDVKGDYKIFFEAYMEGVLKELLKTHFQKISVKYKNFEKINKKENIISFDIILEK